MIRRCEKTADDSSRTLQWPLRSFLFAGALVALAGCGDGGASKSALPGDCPSGCEAGFVCQAGACVPDSVATGCDPACASDQTCVESACVPKDPETGCDPACGAGQRCQAGACVPDTTTAPDCSPPCGATDVCVEGQCVPADPLADVCIPECGAGLTCVAGACVVPGGQGGCEPACEADYSCVNGACVHDGGNTTHEPGAGASWVVLVYLVGDNDLEEFAVDDLSEMLAVGGDAGFRFVVQVDRSSGHSTARVPGIGDWTSAKRLVLQGSAFDEVADLGEVDMANPAVLADFIAWGLATYPADRRMIVFWDHGAGWTGFGVDDGTPGHPLLSLPKLKQGLSLGLQAAGVARFDAIGFDACLMANYETATVLRPFAEYLLASEELEPGHGWDYRAFAAARQHPTIGTVPLLSAVVDGFLAQAVAAKTDKDVTLSVADLTRLGEVKAAVDALASRLTQALPAQAPDVGRSRAATLRFGRAAQEEQEYHLLDLGDLAAALNEGGPPSATQESVALRTLLDDVVLTNRTGPAAAAATGMSVYFPPHSGLYDPAYDGLVELGPWRNFLRSYFQAASLVTAPITLPHDAASTTVRWVDDVATIDVNVPSATWNQITVAEAYYGVLAANGVDTYLYYMEPAWSPSAGVLEAAWDGTVAAIVQGSLSSYAYTEIRYDDTGDLGVMSIPFAYQLTPSAEPSYVELRYTFSVSSGAGYGSAYYLYTDTGIAQLTPAPGSLLTPIIPDVTDTSFEWVFASDAAFDAASPVDVQFVDLFGNLAEGALVYVDITVTDFAGNSDYVSGLLEPAAGCGGVDEVGVCDGDVVYWCENGELQVQDCEADGWVCGYDEQNAYYGCLDNGQTDPCQGVTEVGVCQDNVLYVCDNNQLYYLPCSDEGKTCAWDATQGWYDCL
ncbi:MAG: hypothetical protein EP329_10245 [Deltaproteobacteria bacterium]|nr:MAG: hypothetical protein EP329_10245 [Deltaproteobacteria bacterium]